MKTRDGCTLIAVGGFVLNFLVLYFSARPNGPFLQVLVIVFISYMTLVPVALYFLRGDRAWRLAVFAMWLLCAGVWAYAALTLD